MNAITRLLLFRIRLLTALMMLGLILSGATAIPLETEMNWVVGWTGANQMVQRPSETQPRVKIEWLVKVRDSLRDTNTKYPFMAYGFDWLAFGHFVIAVAFLGAWRDPIRNRWLFDFGLIACAMVIPYALIAGGFRGIPLGWRLIDCSFGFGGAIPMLLCRKYAIRLEGLPSSSASA
jgi:hypothetical protein